MRDANAGLSAALRSSLVNAYLVGSNATTRPVSPTSTCQRHGVGADVGADVQNRIAGFDQFAVLPQRAHFEAAEQIDGEVDAFPQIELPVEAAASDGHLGGEA